MLTTSQIDIDPRINKVARGLAAEGYEVVILCFNYDSKLCLIEHPYPGVSYEKIPFPGWSSLGPFYQEAFLKNGLEEECDVVHANDLTTLLVGWMLSRIKNVPLVYDAHEFWTENVEYNSCKKEYIGFPVWKKWALSKLEKELVKHAKLFISVSKLICEEYQKRYHLLTLPFVLPNYPELSLLKKDGLPSIREQCCLTEKHFVVLYLGGVNPARNIENVILSLRHLPEECVFVVQGPGVKYYEEDYRELAKKVGVENRLFFLGPVRMDQVIETASSADCGIAMLKNLSLNFYLFYPNKVFEYMLAGIPVAVSNFPEVSAHIEREKCGITFDPGDPKSIAKALMFLYMHPEESKKMGERGRRSIIEKYNWDIAMKGFVREYEKLLE